MIAYINMNLFNLFVYSKVLLKSSHVPIVSDIVPNVTDLSAVAAPRTKSRNMFRHCSQKKHSKT